MIDKSKAGHERGIDDPAAIGIPTVAIQTGLASDHSTSKYTYSGVHGDNKNGEICMSLAEKIALKLAVFTCSFKPKGGHEAISLAQLGCCWNGSPNEADYGKDEVPGCLPEVADEQEHDKSGHCELRVIEWRLDP